MPSRWAALPNRYECRQPHGPDKRCQGCQMRHQVYGDARATRHGGLRSTAHGPERADWHRNRCPGMAVEHMEAVRLIHEGMSRNSRAALAICGPGPGNRIALRCWSRIAADAWHADLLLRVAETYAFESHGPAWGKVAGGVAHTESGLLSAVARTMILRSGCKSAVLRPKRTYVALRKMARLLLQPAQPWLVRYSWRAAREWERLRVKRLKAEAAAREAQIAAIKAAEEKSSEQPPS